MAVILGDKVKDTISGTIGIAVTKTYHLNGCVQIGIEAPTTSEGRRVYDIVDIARVEVVEAAAFKPQHYPEAAAPGGLHGFNVPRTQER